MMRSVARAGMALYAKNLKVSSHQFLPVRFSLCQSVLNCLLMLFMTSVFFFCFEVTLAFRCFFIQSANHKITSVALKKCLKNIKILRKIEQQEAQVIEITENCAR